MKLLACCIDLRKTLPKRQILDVTHSKHLHYSGRIPRKRPGDTHMSETLNGSLIAAIVALTSAIAYLYRQIISTKDMHAKCMAAHAASEAKATIFDDSLKQLREEIKVISETRFHPVLPPARPDTVVTPTTTVVEHPTL